MAPFMQAVAFWFAAVSCSGMPDTVERRVARAKAKAEAASSSSGVVAPSEEAASSSAGPRTSLGRRVREGSKRTPTGVREGEQTPFSDHLRAKWAKGAVSATGVREGAELAERQGMPNIGDLASLGGSKASASRMQTALLKSFKDLAGAPPVTWVNLPMVGGRRLHPVLLPHEFFSSLFHARRDIFDESLRGPPDAARIFWDVMRARRVDFFMNNAALSSAHLDVTIPLGLHGDGGSFSHQDSLIVFSFNSIIASRSGVAGFARRFLYTIIRKSDMLEATAPELLRIFSWSTNHLATAITPSLDWDDCPRAGGEQYIAGGFRATLSQIRGDWEFLANVLKLANWNRNIMMCPFCAADNVRRGGLEYTDFSSSANWRGTVRTHASWIER